MQTRKLLIALVALALLIGLVWYLEQSPEEATDGPPETPFFPGLEASAITALEFGAPDKGLRVERRSAGPQRTEDLRLLGLGEVVSHDGTAASASEDVNFWVIPGDPERFADADLAGSAADSLAELTWTESFEAPADLSPFGLEADADEVHFEAEDLGRVTIRMGGTTPVGDKRYLLVESLDKVALVNTWSLRSLEKDPLAFREQRLLPFDTSVMTRLEIQRPGLDPIAVEKQGRVWRFVDGEGLRAEPTTIKALLRDLAGLQASSFGELSEDFSPSLSVRLVGGDGRDITLELAPDLIGGSFSVRTSGELLQPESRGVSATAELDFAEVLLAPADDLRALELLDFNPGTVRSVEWQTRGITWTLKRDEGVWMLAEGESAEPGGVDQAAVDAFLAALDALEAQAYSPDELEALDAGVETARIVLEQEGGHRCGLTLFEGPIKDRVSVEGEPGFREVDGTVRQLLSSHRPFVTPPQPGDAPP